MVYYDKEIRPQQPKWFVMLGQAQGNCILVNS